MATELEIKYAVDGLQRMDRIFCDPMICDRLTQRYHYMQMETTYFDTEDGQLAREHCTLRLRKENGRSIVTVKTPGGRDYARQEWEYACEEIEAALEALVEKGAPAYLAEVFAQTPPLPQCGAKFVRITAVLQLSEQTSCEVCGDMGDLYAAGNTAPLCELEFELKEGSAEEMLAFAKQVAEAYGLPEEKKSKHARARELMG